MVSPPCQAALRANRHSPCVRMFAFIGVSLQITTEAVDAIALRAFHSKTGARGLRSIVEQTLNEAMFLLPTWRSQGVTHVVVTKETIEQKVRTLTHLVLGPISHRMLRFSARRPAQTLPMLYPRPMCEEEVGADVGEVEEDKEATG